MAGTPIGGIRAVSTIRKKYGRDYYIRTGSLGGKAPHTKPRGFATNRQLVSLAGQIGGMRSKRGHHGKTFVPKDIRLYNRILKRLEAVKGAAEKARRQA